MRRTICRLWNTAVMLEESGSLQPLKAMRRQIRARSPERSSLYFSCSYRRRGRDLLLSQQGLCSCRAVKKCGLKPQKSPYHIGKGIFLLHKHLLKQPLFQFFPLIKLLLCVADSLVISGEEVCDFLLFFNIRNKYFYALKI